MMITAKLVLKVLMCTLSKLHTVCANYHNEIVNWMLLLKVLNLRFQRVNHLSKDSQLMQDKTSPENYQKISLVLKLMVLIGLSILTGITGATGGFDNGRL